MKKNNIHQSKEEAINDYFELFHERASPTSKKNHI